MCRLLNAISARQQTVCLSHKKMCLIYNGVRRMRCISIAMLFLYFNRFKTVFFLCRKIVFPTRFIASNLDETEKHNHTLKLLGVK